MPTDDRYLNANEAADYVGATVRGFDQWVRRHGVPHVRYGRIRKFRKEQLDRVLETMALRPQHRRHRG